MIIRAKGLEKVYRGRKVVDNVTFQVETGEVVGLLGPNGAGKTTTFYMTTGLVRPNGGEVFLDDTDVTHWPMYRRAKAGIGYLPQEASIFRKLSVEDNLRLVMEVEGLPKAEQNSRIESLAADLHISHLLRAVGLSLSGGERRRVEIARALATDPKFILLDEPFTGIDPVTIEEIQGIIRRLKSKGIGILITDHNIVATLRITDRNYILIDGQIAVSGTAREIVENEGVRKRYLGTGFDPDADPGVGPDPETLD